MRKEKVEVDLKRVSSDYNQINLVTKPWSSVLSKADDRNKRKRRLKSM